MTIVPVRLPTVAKLRALNIMMQLGNLRMYYDIEEEPEQIFVMQDGKPIAKLMPVTEDKLEDINLSKNTEFLAILEQSRTSLQRKGGISLEQVKQKLGLV
ncbi:MAG: hypothetical protein F6J92_25815 [Symploca sp. SIO1A3]|nr:hypothetical protein [Symploca sp. SIO1A3]